MIVAKINHGEKGVINVYIVCLNDISVKVTLRIEITLIIWICVIKILIYI